MSFGGPPPGGFGGPPPGGFGGPPPGDPPGGGFGGPPGGGFGGPPPDGGGFGGPPGGGFGGPPPGGGFGGPPGGGFGGPPPGGGYGGPPQGPFGPPPGPFGSGPFAGPPVQLAPKSSSSLPLILGVGCGGLVLLGILAVVGAALFARGKTSPPAPVYAGSPPPVPTRTAPATPAAGDLKAELANLTPIKSKYGKSTRFIGEITNTGSSSIGYPMAKVTFFDAAGTAVDSGNCSSLVRVLPAGDKIPCSFSIFKSQDWKTYKVEVNPIAPLFRGEVADIDITDIKFTAKRGYQPDTLEGKLTNKSTFKAKSVWAIVTLYDSAKKIVGTDNTLVAGNDLEGGASGLFTAKVYDVAGVPDSYRVIAIGYSE